MQDVSDESVRLPFEGNLKGNSKRRKDFGILLQVQVWIVINVIHFAPSTAVVIGDSLPTLGLRSTQETNVFPWKQTCHATIGLSNKIHLYREEPAGDLTNLTSVRWCDFWKPSCGLTVWAPAVIVRHMHLTESFALFISPMAFLQLYLGLLLLRLVLYEHSPQLDDSSNTNVVEEKSFFLLKTQGPKIEVEWRACCMDFLN